MSLPAIRVEKLSKQYAIGVRANGYRTLRESLGVALAGSVRRWSRRDGETAARTTFWALKDLDLEIQPGEVVGVIGRNGAGKSTLLKILSRITEPTDGRVRIRGRVGSLLEVGTGFHPELTGRENIALNGAILGMTRREIALRFDEIVAFAEVEQFIDTPVKRYSSGMYLRLAFAVAAHLEPEILLVDEVLAVGDASFQKKCLGKMGDVARQGRTVLLVSHNLGAIRRLCGRALWLDGGRLAGYAAAEQIVSRYLITGVDRSGEVVFSGKQAPGSEHVRLLAVRIRDRDGQITSAIDMQQPFTIELEYEILKEVRTLRVGWTLTAQDGTDVLSSTDMDVLGDEMERCPGSYQSRCTMPGNLLNSGHYAISVGSDFPRVQTHFYQDRVLTFEIVATGGVGGHVQDGRRGLIRMSLPWQILGAPKGVSDGIHEGWPRLALAQEKVR